MKHWPPTTGMRRTVRIPSFRRIPLRSRKSRCLPSAPLRSPGKDVFTLTPGGLRINAKTQVLNTEGKVIAGLYAAGVTAAMICGEYYRGGTSTSTSQAFGRIAGIEMARELSHA
ncbi:MAG: FAD-binding protein [Gammaproteobacteria bacterium]|nr:FAD-binding protein [Gammaproteobacteria bacterium]